MRRDLVRAHFKCRKTCKGRLKRADKLGFKLRVDFRALVGLLNIAADVCVKQQRICDLIGINAVASDFGVRVKSYTVINNAEGDGRCGAESVIDYLLGVEVVNALILAGVAAEGKALADGLEGVKYRLTETAGENARLSRCIVCKLSRLCADLDNLALLDDYHALAVGNGNARAAGNDVVVAPGVRRARACALCTLYNECVFINCVAVEKLLPLVCHRSAESACAGPYKSHINKTPFKNELMINVYCICM